MTLRIEQLQKSIVGRVVQYIRLLHLLFACFLMISLSAMNLYGHDVDDVSPLNFVGYVAPFGSNQSTTYTDLWAEGNYAVMGTLESGVAILDVSMNGTIPHVGTFVPSTPNAFQDVKMRGDYGYFSSSDGGGTFVVDLSIPSEPEMVSQINSTLGGHDSVRNAVLDGQHLFQVDPVSSLIHVFDISLPDQPLWIRSVDTGDAVGIYDVTVTGNRMYAAGLGGTAGEGAVYVYDIDQIASNSPELLGQIPTGANTSSVALTQDENYLVVTHRQLGGDLAVWDIANLNQPTEVSSADASDLGLSSYSTSEVIIKDDILYVSWWEAGVQVLDLDNDLLVNGMQLIGQFDTSLFSSPLDGYVGNQSVFAGLGHDRVLLSDSQWGFHVVDATVAIPDLSASADFNGDGDVDGADLLTWQLGNGTVSGANRSDGDANGDGRVDGTDRIVWQNSFGDINNNFQPVLISVPESTGQILAGIAILAIILRNWWFPFETSNRKY